MYLASDSNATISRSVFRSNGIGRELDGAGIRADSDAMFTIVGNSFQNNQHSLVLINPTKSGVSISNNDFASNRGYAIKAYTDQDQSNSVVIQAPSNYWGSRGAADPEVVIFDNDDDFRAAQIVPSNALATAPVISQQPLPTTTPSGSISIEVGISPSGVEGQQIALVSTRVVSVGTPGAMVAEIDWGDGQGIQSAVVIQETELIVGSHNYGVDSVGVYTATITVRSDFGGSSTAQISVIVTPS